MKTRQDVKRWLKSYEELSKEKEQLLQSIKDIEKECDGIKAQALTGMPLASGDYQSVQERSIMRLVKIEEQWIRKCDEATKTKYDIERAISLVESSTHRRLLRHKYIDCMKWEEVAYKMGYCWSRTHDYHREALDMIYRIVSHS